MTRHALDPVAFVGGALFTIFGGFALLGGDASKVNGGWVWPALLAAAGIALMALTARSLVARRPRDTVPPATEPNASTAGTGAPAEPDAPADSDAVAARPDTPRDDPGGFGSGSGPADGNSS